MGTINMSNNIKERQGSPGTDVETSNDEEIKNKRKPCRTDCAVALPCVRNPIGTGRLMF